MAIESVAKSSSDLMLYSVSNITSETSSQGEVAARLQRDDRVVNGQGADTDILAASAKAYLNALNTLMAAKDKKHPQVTDKV